MSTSRNASEIQKIIHYNPETGIFTRLEKTSSNAKRGEILGNIDKVHGYVRIMVGGKRYLAHRLAWFYTHGYWPPNDIDHINGDKVDNRICNLREATRAENTQNIRRAQINNFSTGVLGVSFDSESGKFKASIGINGKTKNLGRFSTIEEASVAYESAKREHCPYFIGLEARVLPGGAVIGTSSAEPMGAFEAEHLAWSMDNGNDYQVELERVVGR
jgi:hypothetical protein